MNAQWKSTKANGIRKKFARELSFFSQKLNLPNMELKATWRIFDNLFCEVFNLIEILFFALTIRYLVSTRLFKGASNFTKNSVSKPDTVLLVLTFSLDIFFSIKSFRRKIKKFLNQKMLYHWKSYCKRINLETKQHNMAIMDELEYIRTSWSTVQWSISVGIPYRYSSTSSWWDPSRGNISSI